MRYFLQSVSYQNSYSYFTLGFLYHFGIVIKQDIKASIRNYKEASSLNNNYAKNNLGIIYKYGIKNEVDENLELAKIYFKEAINQKK